MMLNGRLLSASRRQCVRTISSMPPKHALAAAQLSSYAEPPKSAAERQPTDHELLQALSAGVLAEYKLESHVNDAMRAARLRRQHIASGLSNKRALDSLPLDRLDGSGFYESVHGTNAECVIGYVPIPVGVVGPLSIDGENVRVPMATTEGALIASTNRGARAINASGGCTAEVYADSMSRAPVVAMPSIREAVALKQWLEAPDRLEFLQQIFSTTTRFGDLKGVMCTVSGRNLFIRFSCASGDAMGMNMVGKGINKVMEELKMLFPSMRLVSLSGNMCTDKKPSAVNWIQGRGKSVVCETVLKGSVVRKVLKTTPSAMAELNVTKNLVGSAMAGSIGGFNAHASNIVTACFLATGQDPAQNVESSNCIMHMEPVNGGEDLLVTCTMPCLEVGTIGGGTSLTAQASCLDMLGVRGSNEVPGSNAQKLAKIICATVLAGEISLAAALTSGHLISAHMSLNRKVPAPPTRPAAGGPERSPSTQLRGQRVRRHNAQISSSILDEADENRYSEKGWATPRLPVP